MSKKNLNRSEIIEKVKDTSVRRVDIANIQENDVTVESLVEYFSKYGELEMNKKGVYKIRIGKDRTDNFNGTAFVVFKNEDSAKEACKSDGATDFGISGKPIDVYLHGVKRNIKKENKNQINKNTGNKRNNKKDENNRQKFNEKNQNKDNKQNQLENEDQSNYIIQNHNDDQSKDDIIEIPNNKNNDDSLINRHDLKEEKKESNSKTIRRREIESTIKILDLNDDNITEDHLYEYFSKYGEISVNKNGDKKISVKINPNKGSRVVSIVYKNIDDALKASNQANGAADLGRYPIRVIMATDKQEVEKKERNINTNRRSNNQNKNQNQENNGKPTNSLRKPKCILPCRVNITNIKDLTTVEYLVHFFSQYGEIQRNKNNQLKVGMKKDKRSAFVTYKDHESALRACQANKTTLFGTTGRPITITLFGSNETGRATCRESEWISVDAGSLENKQTREGSSRNS
eukprot:TRINITY_DN7498_c0_g2_i1.p1 TRINITY_DN7498_c0_g2~~TRINITY_DN7498_c0_g2_i1.p1  ORF type:complete len:460 (-),score=113.03 TRINITY_DN7498_c0_g2_i1:120-1499(-)